MTPNWVEADWPAPANIHAGTTLRTGGESKIPYDSNNLAAHVGDDLNAVEKNRQYLKSMLNLPADPCWLDQNHGNKVINIDKGEQCLTADASYSLKPEAVCVVLTADCLPVLLCNEQGAKIAAVHAGWRGLLNGVIENAVSELKDNNLMAWLGPAIGPECFEVGDEVFDIFFNKSHLFSSAFQSKGQAKWLLDIYKLARLMLNNVGVKKIYGGNFCTMTEQKQFFSYRRDGKTGRMASLIWRI